MDGSTTLSGDAYTDYWALGVFFIVSGILVTVAFVMMYRYHTFNMQKSHLAIIVALYLFIAIYVGKTFSPISRDDIDINYRSYYEYGCYMGAISVLKDIPENRDVLYEHASDPNDFYESLEDVSDYCLNEMPSLSYYEEHLNSDLCKTPELFK